MLGRGKRVLLPKEQRLTVLTADVVHLLYKPFDQFKITQSIAHVIAQWVKVDLGL